MDGCDVGAGPGCRAAVKGVVERGEKRRDIGETFIRVFEDAAEEIGHVDFLAQGTLYPDVIESTAGETPAAAKIKTQHNVGGRAGMNPLIMYQRLGNGAD